MLRSKVLAQWAGGLVIFLGVLTLAGWIFGISTLKTVLPGLVSMKANSALCFIMAACSLLLQTRLEPAAGGRLVLAQVLAAVVTLAALFTLVEYGFGVSLGLDQLPFRESAEEAGASFAGRMSPASCLDFVLVGTALLGLDVQGRWLVRWPAESCALAAAVISLLAFIVYFYGVAALSPMAPYTTIALHTVIAFWLLCLGILFARPQRGVMAVFTSESLGGIVARRMLPTAILLPLLAGWLGVLGERAGLYGLGFGTALLATVVITTFAALVTWAAGALNRAEQELNLSRENLRALAARLEAVREEERTHVAREIHDVLAQELTRLKMDIAWFNRRLAEPADDSKPRLLQEKLAGMSEVTDAAIGSVQRIATELRPVVLDSLGLCAAIEWQAKDFETRTGIRCQAGVPDHDLPLDREYSTALFRILQESLTNVARHAEATRVEVDLRSEGDWIALSIRDNGRGIKAAELDNAGSIGLLGMRERAALLGGNCRINGRPEGGTAVEARFPFQPKANSRPKSS